MADEQPSAPARSRRGARLRRWGAVVIAALVLLALSQALWLWQSWPVRQLLLMSPSATGESR
jgi:hypothetical protein